MNTVPSRFLAIRPSNFLITNRTVLPTTILKKVLNEFEAIIHKLEELGMEVLIVHDKTASDKALFATSWISCHVNKVAIYPLKEELRRVERQEYVIESLDNILTINDVIDYSSAEEEGLFLEGRSVVLDKNVENAFVGIGELGDADIAIEFCEDFEYTPIFFEADVYTDQILLITEKFVLVDNAQIKNKKERKQVLSALKENEKVIISVNTKQVESMVLQSIEVIGKDGLSYFFMSQIAFDCLTESQKTSIEQFSKVIVIPLEQIETSGLGLRSILLSY